MSNQVSPKHADNDALQAIFQLSQEILEEQRRLRERLEEEVRKMGPSRV